MKKMNMKKWGIVLLCFQLLGIVSGIMSGHYISMLNLPIALAISDFIGFHLLGIIGICLVIVYNHKLKKENETKAEFLQYNDLDK